ncbi:MAG TPA: M48 family metallopeptidase [Vicinamibacterales bacterium]|jgi:Zn-dependent protease with chaperone function|nr:M48 family metallopeptidase [Vicinamibacterales bacterium]
MALKPTSVRAVALVLALSVSASLVFAQTVIKPPKNKYTPKQDVQLGKEGAAEVRKQYPIINDPKISSYLTTLGDRLVAAAPPELKESVYEYSFTPVNLKDINAFALPGGPMFVNRGMFDAALEEGEVVGVMAHELSHVLLRHGTANASKAQNPWLQLGQMAGMIGGAMVGGGVGSAIAQGSQFGLGTLLLKYSREYEKQADLLGAQIMAKAGYDPKALAHMFQTIQKEAQESGGGGTPQWMSSHPDPGNRTQYITKEASLLTIAKPADDSGFIGIKSAFAALPTGKPMGEPGKNAATSETVSVGTPGQPVPAPSTQYRNITGGKVFQASVPSNWTTLSSASSVKVVPENGYGDMNGDTVFSHGVEFGVTKASSRDLYEATKTWLQAVGQANPEMRLAGEQQQMQMSQRSALGTPIVNPSPLGGQERIAVYTTFLADGSLFYYLSVVPEKDAEAFREAFRHIGQSIKLTEVR